MLLHVLAHVDMDQRIGVAEHEFRQRLGQQRFTDTGGTGEDKAAGGTLRIFQSAAAAANRFGDRRDGRVLADDPLVQFFFHLHQPHASLRSTDESAECRSSC